MAKIERVMTFEQWKREVKRRKRRRFVRKWNGTIDKIQSILGGQ